MKETQYQTNYISDAQQRKKEINQFLARLKIWRPNSEALSEYYYYHAIFAYTGKLIMQPVEQRCPLIFYVAGADKRELLNMLTGQVQFEGDLFRFQQQYLRRLMIFFGCFPAGLKTRRENRLDLLRLPSVIQKYGANAELEKLAHDLGIESASKRERYFKVCCKLYYEFGHERAIIELCAEHDFEQHKQIAMSSERRDKFSEW